MSNNFENSQSASQQLGMPEPLKLDSNIINGEGGADVDEALMAQQKEDALKDIFLQKEIEVKARQDNGESPSNYTKYKLAIFDQLLKNKSVDFPRVVRQLRGPNNPDTFDLGSCYSAFETVRFYSNNAQELHDGYQIKNSMELSDDPAQYVEQVSQLFDKISTQKQAMMQRNNQLGIPSSKYDYYRLAILENLFKNNRVEMSRLGRELQEEEGDDFDPEAFQDAYLILDRENKLKTQQVQKQNEEKEEVLEKQPTEPVSPEIPAELNNAIISEIPEEPNNKYPDKKIKAKIIGAAVYKTIASIVGLKSVVDWLGAGLGSLGLKIGQRTDVYKYFDQKKETAQDRGDINNALEKLIEAAAARHDFKQAIYQDERYIKLVAETNQLLEGYKQTEDVEARAILADKMKQNQEEKKKIAQEYAMVANQAEKDQELKNLAIEYNNLIDNARSTAYYDLPVQQRQQIDANWDHLSEAERSLYTLPEADKRTMKIRLGQVLINNLEKNDALADQRRRSAQDILRDYVHGKVEASALIKDSLNTALTLTGAGALRGFTYWTMAMVERSKSKNREFRKEYSWNQVGEKISSSRRLFDLFVTSMKETYYGLSGRRFVQKYTVDKQGKLKRYSDKIQMKGLPATALRAQSLGEITRLFGIGTQTMAAIVTEGMSLQGSLENIADTFKGDALGNMANNWYQNFRIDQRIAKSLKILQDKGDHGGGQMVTEKTTAVGTTPEKPDTQDIDLKHLENLDTIKIAQLAEQGHRVVKGGSVSEALGRSVSGREDMLLITFNNKGEPIIYDGYNPNVIAPDARVLDYGGRLVAIDNDSSHLHFYEQHYFDDLSKQIDINLKQENIGEQVVLSTLAPQGPKIEEVVSDSTIVHNMPDSASLGKYSDHPYFNLTTKGKIDYDDLVHGNSDLYRQFVMFNRPGGAWSTNAGQDLLSDIDRIYHNEDLSVADRIKILEGIKEVMVKPDLVSHVNDSETKDLLSRTYQHYADSIDHSIELLKHPDGQPIPEEWNGGLDEFIKWRDAHRPTGN